VIETFHKPLDSIVATRLDIFLQIHRALKRTATFKLSLRDYKSCADTMRTRKEIGGHKPVAPNGRLGGDADGALLIPAAEDEVGTLAGEVGDFHGDRGANAEETLLVGV
jgi:hypothetical protein